MLSSTFLLGVKITLNKKAEILSFAENYLRSTSAKPLTIVTPNPEQVVKAHENPEFRELLNSADISLPDGVGIVFAAQILNAPQPPLNKRGRGGVIERIPGVEFMEDLVKLAAE